MIRADRLHKRFGDTVAVHEVSLEAGRGEVIGFLGPNGAGKSTTIRMITGVFPPTSGRAWVGGFDVVRDPIRARRVLGYLPERNAIYGEMTAEAYLRFVCAMKGLSAGRERDGAVARAMSQTGIAHVAHRLTRELSKGYRQRVGIAQALLGDPPVLILDEPTSGLDPEQVAEIRNLIFALGAERTILLSTHILPEVELMCARVIIMYRGRVLAVDRPRDLERRLRPYRQLSVTLARDARAAALAGLRALPRVAAVVPQGSADAPEATFVVSYPHDADLRREIAQTVGQSGGGLLDLHPVEMTLEEIFLTLVAGTAAESGTTSSKAPSVGVAA